MDHELLKWLFCCRLKSHFTVYSSLTNGCLDFIHLIVESSFNSIIKWINEREESTNYAILEINLKRKNLLHGKSIRKSRERTPCRHGSTKETIGKIRVRLLHFLGRISIYKKIPRVWPSRKEQRHAMGPFPSLDSAQPPSILWTFHPAAESMDNDRFAPCYFTSDLVQPRR